MTNRNPILDELRKTREALLADAGGELSGLVEKLKRDEQESGRKVLDADEFRRRRQTNRQAGDSSRG